MNIALLLGGVYWTETLLARSLRLHEPCQRREGRPVRHSQPLDSTGRALRGAPFFWGFIAIASTLFWLLFT